MLLTSQPTIYLLLNGALLNPRPFTGTRLYAEQRITCNLCTKRILTSWFAMGYSTKYNAYFDNVTTHPTHAMQRHLHMLAC
jgi:hypothetical protein